jgi:putative restriction endonuclease
MTVTKEYRVDISTKIREEFDNGREYYAFKGRQLELPESIKDKPFSEFIEWHNKNVFLS